MIRSNTIHAVVLYTAALLPLVLLPRFARIHNDRPLQDRVIDRAIFAEPIETNTTYAYRSTLTALACEKRQFQPVFSAANLTLIAPAGHSSTDNLIARFRGRNRDHATLFFAHLDVIDAAPKDWSIDPLHLTEQTGCFYGQRAMGSESGAAALTDAQIRLRSARHSVFAAFTADEEAEVDYDVA